MGNGWRRSYFSTNYFVCKLHEMVRMGPTPGSIIVYKRKVAITLHKRSRQLPNESQKATACLLPTAKVFFFLYGL